MEVKNSSAHWTQGDTLAIFTISASDGTLNLLTHYSHKSFGVHTRNMRIIEGRTEGRRHLVVAHQDNDTLAVYALDVVSGLVSGEGPVATASVPSAGNVCVYEF